jgi:hypothetical protein
MVNGGFIKMQKFIVFNTKSEADSLNAEITMKIMPSFTDGITNNYCDVKKHPQQELFAVVVDPNYIQYFTEEEIDSSVELSQDWFISNI